MNLPKEGIPCTQTRTGKIIQVLSLGALCLFFINFVPNTCLIWWIPLFFLITSGLFASPDFTIYEDGIEIDFIFFGKRFIKWENISSVRKTSVNMRIYSKNLTFLNHWGSGMRKAILIIPFWRNNYRVTVDVLRQKLPDRFVETI